MIRIHPIGVGAFRNSAPGRFRKLRSWRTTLITMVRGPKRLCSYRRLSFRVPVADLRARKDVVSSPNRSHEKLIPLFLVCISIATATAQVLPEDFVKRNDRNGDGKLSRDEFPEWAKSKIDLIDTDHDGFVTVDEMRAFLAQQGGAGNGGNPATGEKKPMRPDQILPTPTHPNVSYGPDESNVLDFWQAPAGAPNPLLVMIHGGGFRAGSKAQVSAGFLRACFQAGISVASIEYRFTQKAPYPAQMLDCARALQFIRSKAGEWNIDPKRVAATGGSAGAGISLWLGFHKDLADPNNSDPVARESTRLTCIIPTSMQCTYDPRVIKTLIPAMLTTSRRSSFSTGCR